MKTKRRHELRENTLARVITKTPSFWQDSGGKFLIGAIVLLAIVLLVRYRISSGRVATAQAGDNLAMARNLIDDLEASGQYAVPPAQLAAHRKQAFGEAANFIEEAGRLSDDPGVGAESLVAKGDLNWTMANLASLPGAATQPSLQVTRDPADLINAAADAYKQVLEKYADNKQAVIAARFGLAAIAENRGDWDAAKTQYQQIIATPGITQAYLEQARERLAKLPTLAQPVLLAAPTTAPSSLTPELPPFIAAPHTTTAPKGTPPQASTRSAAIPMISPSTRPAATRPAR